MTQGAPGTDKLDVINPKKKTGKVFKKSSTTSDLSKQQREKEPLNPANAKPSYGESLQKIKEIGWKGRQQGKFRLIYLFNFHV